MTRINIIPPNELTDQHLVAEYKEIRQLVGGLQRTLNSKNGFQEKKVPEQFTLNEGHCYFFYDKGAYIHVRYNRVRSEMIDRGFEPKHKFPLEKWPVELYGDWSPTKRDMDIVRERIALRISERPNWYRYRGKLLANP